MPITGANAKRVLFGAINLRTAHRVVLVRPRAGGADAQAFLRELRRRYRTAGTIWLLADRASTHTAARTQCWPHHSASGFSGCPSRLRN